MVSVRARCVHRHYLNNDVHAFIFHYADEETVDEFIQQFREVLHQQPRDETLLMLVDLRPMGIPPFAYTLNAVARLFKEPQIANPEPPKIRAAYIYDQSRFIEVMKRFFGLLKLNNQRRFFKGQQVEALAWLLGGEDATSA